MIHFIHTWIHSSLSAKINCIAPNCPAVITYEQFYNYPHLKFFKTSNPYWYDIPCDEIWRKIK